MAENTVTMEIIDSEQYKRANIRFNGKPSEEIREELKKEGWFYSRNHNVWYPKNDAAEKSRDFAQHIRDTYFPTQKEEIKIITEATEKDELQAMIQNGSSLKDILSKLSDMYGDNAVHEAFNEVRQHIDSAKEKPEVAEVIEVGPGTADVKMEVKKGDKVLISKYSGTNVKLEGEEFIIVKMEDILATVK